MCSRCPRLHGLRPRLHHCPRRSPLLWRWGTDPDDGETCDDGNRQDDDGCPADCVLVGCGNGVLELGEYCDDGNGINTDSCPNTCQFARCGDGFVMRGAESCDDGNTITEDCPYGVFGCEVCSEQCQTSQGLIHVCGDGILDGPEGCDDGNVKTEECEYGVPECVVCAANCTEKRVKLSSAATVLKTRTRNAMTATPSPKNVPMVIETARSARLYPATR